VSGGFTDRIDAGQQLAEALRGLRNGDGVILGLARGGVVVGFAVARALDLPLRALVVRKLGAPQNPELAIGAVSETGVRWLDTSLVQATGATDAYLQQEVAAQVAEARRRQEEYASVEGLETVRGQPAIVVDDGIATGATALVAVQSARDLGASEVIMATPVASQQAVQLLRQQADDVVTLLTPNPFIAVGLYYRNFEQVSDAEVKHYLAVAGSREGVQQ
jgi:predicted phosphoribosyltransferase